jgi:hypothetical protein
MTTDDPVQLHEFAEDAAKDAIALVEIEAVQGYDPARGAGEEVRVVRTLAGSSLKRFRVERRPFASGASCDDLMQTGRRAVIILYPAREVTSQEPTLRVSGLCTNLLLDKPVFREAVVRRIGVGERG